jgi:DnaK suppressor protein
MEEMEKKELKNIIIEQLAKLEIDLVGLKDLTRPISPDNAIGRLTRMEAIGEKSVNEAAFKAAELRFHRLTDAAKRLEFEDDFGECLICEEPIPFSRLKIMPESTLCVPCAEDR